jgi:hypothetical protein
LKIFLDIPQLSATFLEMTKSYDKIIEFLEKLEDFTRFYIVGKPSLQIKFTLLKSKFFPAKIPFSKIQKNEFYFAKEEGH